MLPPQDLVELKYERSKTEALELNEFGVTCELVEVLLDIAKALL